MTINQTDILVIFGNVLRFIIIHFTLDIFYCLIVQQLLILQAVIILNDSEIKKHDFYYCLVGFTHSFKTTKIKDK